MIENEIIRLEKRNEERMSDTEIKQKVKGIIVRGVVLKRMKKVLARERRLVHNYKAPSLQGI